MNPPPTHSPVANAPARLQLEGITKRYPAVVANNKVSLKVKPGEIHAILGENSRVCKNAIVGGAYAEGEKKKISVTSKGAVVEANTVLKPGDML